jgi:hypothetical protein
LVLIGVLSFGPCPIEEYIIPPNSLTFNYLAGSIKYAREQIEIRNLTAGIGLKAIALCSHFLNFRSKFIEKRKGNSLKKHE